MLNKRGFSLIEMIMVLVMLSLVVWVLVTAYLAGQAVFNNEKNVSDAFLETTKAAELMEKEIRGGIEAQTALPASFTFWFDDTNENGSSEASEIVTYSWDGTVGGDLLRTVDGSSTIISKNITYFNASYDSGTVSDIKSVNIMLMSKFGDKTVTIESTSSMRNKS